MNSHPRRFPPPLLLAAMICALILAACTESVSEQEQITNIQTIIAGTPSATPSPTPTLTPTITPTLTPTVGPSPVPTDTPLPTPTPPPTLTPLPPTPTPNPALSGFSLCEQQAGSGSGRFSARLGEVTVTGFPAFERLSLSFAQPEGSAPLHAGANCVSERDFIEQSGESIAPGPFVLRIDLADWLRDEDFAASSITRTLSFTSSRVISAAGFRVDPNRETGATLLIGLSEVLPYRLRLERDPLQLTIEVARSSTLVSSSDPLTVPAGGGKVAAPPLFFLLDGDLWRVGPPEDNPAPAITPDNGGATNLTDSVETETDFALSPDGARLAFCRAAPGIDPAESSFAVPSTLWVMDSDGANARKLAEVGVNCAEPAFSPDGTQLVFSVDETGATPAQRAIWAVPADGGSPRRLAGGDEWSRTRPQWLAGERLIYAAAAEDGRRTLFLRETDGAERDIGADLLLTGDGQLRYSALIEPLAAPDGRTVAVSAPRADGYGAQLLLLAADGRLVEALGGGDNSRRDYWVRPLGWTTGGELFYLTTICNSTVIQDYQLYRWQGPARSNLLLTGTSLGVYGAATAVGDGLAYVASNRGAGGLRGPGAIALRSPSTLWYWDIAGGPRGMLLEAARGIEQLR